VPGRFNYRKRGIKGSKKGMLLLFQYRPGGKKSCVVAHANLRMQCPPDGHSPVDSQGYWLLDAGNLRFLTRPLSLSDMRGIWPGFEFSHPFKRLDVGPWEQFLSLAASR
jgi:hypothetical protein